MAQLLLISAATKRDSNAIGDIVGIFEDDHVFSPAEIAGFDIKKMAGKVADVEAGLEAMKPETVDDERCVCDKYQFTLVDEKAADLSDAVTCNLVAEKIPAEVLKVIK